MVTPLLAALARSAGRTALSQATMRQPAGRDAAELEDHVVIGGFGRVGQTVARLLEAENVPFVALDANAPWWASSASSAAPSISATPAGAECWNAPARRGRAPSW